MMRRPKTGDSRVKTGDRRQEIQEPRLKTKNWG